MRRQALHAEITPRERVLLALSWQQTDRVPVDFLAARETWAALRRERRFPPAGLKANAT